jgi:hypothetical protein
MEITPVTADIFRFHVEGRNVSGLPTTNPVTVVLTIGDDTGTKVITADFDGKHSDED